MIGSRTRLPAITTAAQNSSCPSSGSSPNAFSTIIGTGSSPWQRAIVASSYGRIRSPNAGGAVLRHDSSPSTVPSTITPCQYQSLQSEACRLAEELPRAQLLDSLVAVYEAGRLLHMTKSALIALLGSVALRCVDGEIDDQLPPVPPAAGLWPRLVRAAAYDDQGNLALAGVDDNDRLWHESVTGRSQEAWLLKQLYVERKFGRRPRQAKPRKKPAR